MWEKRFCQSGASEKGKTKLGINEIERPINHPSIIPAIAAMVTLP